MAVQALYQSTSNSEQAVTMSNPAGTTFYLLYSRGSSINCITSYDLTGGPEQPFEVLTMKIPKKRLSYVAPALVNNIEAGKTVVNVKAVGLAVMTVAKCKLSGGTYTITAYGKAEKYRGAYTKRDYGAGHTKASGTADYYYTYVSDTGTNYKRSFYFGQAGSFSPLGIILDILTSSNYQGVQYTRAQVITNYSASNAFTGGVWFPTGTNVWYVLQVCAMMLGCKIFFVGDYAYVLDVNNANSTVNFGSFDLTPSTNTASGIDTRVVGEPSLGDEGTDGMYNTGTVYYESGLTKSTQYSNSTSVSYYGGYTKTYSVPSFYAPADCQALVSRGLTQYLDAQQSISFILKEQSSTGWASYFPVNARATTITDTASGTRITCNSTCLSSAVYGRLTLSTFTRMFPEGCTKYAFGVLTPTDLTQAISQVTSSTQNSSSSSLSSATYEDTVITAPTTETTTT